MLGIIHLADTRDQAIDDCTYGLQDFANYFGAAGFVPLNNEVEGTQTPRQFVEDYASKGNCCIGTPADAVAYIQDLLDRSGGFGTFLMLGHDWASPAATYHSYELFAREVDAALQGSAHRAARVTRMGQGHARPAARAARARPSSTRSPNTPTSNGRRPSRRR